MIRSNLSDYNDAYIHVKATITVPNTATTAKPVSNTNENVIFKNCTPFISCILRINNKQVDDPQGIDIVMPMYNLIEYSDTYSKISGRLCKFYRDKPAIDNNNNIIDFPANKNNSISFKFKQQITRQTRNGGTKDAEVMGSLKYLINLSKNT